MNDGIKENTPVSTIKGWIFRIGISPRMNELKQAVRNCKHQHFQLFTYLIILIIGLYRFSCLPMFFERSCNILRPFYLELL